MAEPPTFLEVDPTSLRLALCRLGEAAAMESHLTDEERRAAVRLAHPAVRSRHIVSRVVRRRLLAECIGRPASELRFGGDGEGKPRLVDARGWDFNTSHAGDYVVVAAAPFPVGVDLEEMRDVPEMERIVQRYFHPDEASVWALRPPDSRRTDFFVLWSAREAAMKCTGSGLAVGMEITRVDPDILDEREAGARVGEVALTLRRLEAPPGYVMIIAMAA